MIRASPGIVHGNSGPDGKRLHPWTVGLAGKIVRTGAPEEVHILQRFAAVSGAAAFGTVTPSGDSGAAMPCLERSAAVGRSVARLFGRPEIACPSMRHPSESFAWVAATFPPATSRGSLVMIRRDEANAGIRRRPVRFNVLPVWRLLRGLSRSPTGLYASASSRRPPHFRALRPTSSGGPELHVHHRARRRAGMAKHE